MPRTRFRWIYLFLLFFINLSCASNQTILLVPPEIGTPTSTPFQPGVYDIPFLPPNDPPIVATFTAYPTKHVPQNGIVNPEVILPTASAVSGEPPSSLIDPLTGLQPDDPSLLNRRPLAIKVANFPRYVRPQSGLTRADVVFEYYIESLLTRFIAVFYGTDSTAIGPVRSGRYFDEHITRMYHSFFAFKFADPREYTFFKLSDLADFLLTPPGYGTCPPFFTGKDARDSYNNVFFDSTRLAECAAKKGVDNSRQTIRSDFFSEEPSPSNTSVYRIFTHYSVDDYNYWEYDPATHKYLRYQEVEDMRNGKAPTYAALIDKETQLQVNTDNLVILFVPHIYANENEAEDEVFHINLLNAGNAFVFRDGRLYQAQWNRIQVDQPLLLTDLGGAPIFLSPGRTFFEVIGRTSLVSQNGVDIFFTFNTP